MKNQDKLDCQKIKEMIINNTLSISSLSESHLNMLIEYETERLMECEAEYDMAFMDLCCNALERIHPLSVPTDEKIKEISENAYQEYMNMNSINKSSYYTPKAKIYPTKKLLRYFIAAAILLVALTATVAAVWNPFVSWLKERKLIDVKQGEVLENDVGCLTNDREYTNFSSIDELEKELEINLNVLHNFLYTPQSIKYTTQGTQKEIITQYNIEQKKIVVKTYLQNAPYQREALEQEQYEKRIIGETEWYVITIEDTTIICFDNNYVYTVTANSLNTIIRLMEG